MSLEKCFGTVFVDRFTDGVLDPAKPMLGPVKDGGFIVANTAPGCWGPMITPELKGGHEVTVVESDPAAAQDLRQWQVEVVQAVARRGAERREGVSKESEEGQEDQAHGHPPSGRRSCASRCHRSALRGGRSLRAEGPPVRARPPSRPLRLRPRYTNPRTRSASSPDATSTPHRETRSPQPTRGDTRAELRCRRR